MYSFIKQTKCINEINTKIKDATPTRVGETIKSLEITCAKFKASYKCCNYFANILPSAAGF
jgi:hypothetical protein